MAKAKKAAESAKPAGTKPIADVAHPGTTAPSDTSKPIINQRPIMKDPMVVEGDKPEEKQSLPAKKTVETKIAPIAPPEEPAADEATPEADKAPEPEPDAEKPAESEPVADNKADAEEKDEQADSDNEKKTPKSGPDTESKAEAAEDAKLQQLIDSKKYFLPINAVEHRRSKRVVIVGVVLALILVVAWVDIALDAGLIHIEGVKPVTHFFSN